MVGGGGGGRATTFGRLFMGGKKNFASQKGMWGQKSLVDNHLMSILVMQRETSLHKKPWITMSYQCLSSRCQLCLSSTVHTFLFHNTRKRVKVGE